MSSPLGKAEVFLLAAEGFVKDAAGSERCRGCEPLMMAVIGVAEHLRHLAHVAIADAELLRASLEVEGGSASPALAKSCATSAIKNLTAIGLTGLLCQDALTACPGRLPDGGCGLTPEQQKDFVIPQF